MTFLTALGFLGLIGLAVLILIYILKPNYQQKLISSSYVWKLSLKYKKKRIPINKLRNIIILICQILIITIASFILAQPFIQAGTSQRPDKIIIIDASASMQAFCKTSEPGEIPVNDSITRFQKAISEAKVEGQKTIAMPGRTTVIIAGAEPEIVTYREEKLDIFNKAMNGNTVVCEYGGADIDGAMLIADSILLDNPKAEVIYYTATEYISKGKVKVVYVTDHKNNEWNAAILNVEAEINPATNYYDFTITVASYNRDAYLTVRINVYDVNTDDVFTSNHASDIVTNISCSHNDIVTVPPFEDLQVYSFGYAEVWLETDVPDSFAQDNSFFLYGGIKEEIKVIYVSSYPEDTVDSASGTDISHLAGHSLFLSGGLRVLRSILAKHWNISIIETQIERLEKEAQDKEVTLESLLSGYDFYIFEHQIPKILPGDGVVFLINPDTIPIESSIKVGKIFSKPDVGSDNYMLQAGQSHPIMKGISAELINIARYRTITEYDEDNFDILLTCGTDPIFFVRNDANIRMAMLAFPLQFSNFPMINEWPSFLYNLFVYYFPPTLNKNVFDVNEAISINARGPALQVFLPGQLKPSFTLESFPSEFSASSIGTYKMSQIPFGRDESVDEYFFVKIAASQSDFARVETQLKNPFFPPVLPPVDLDLLIFFAAAMIALLFLLWFLYIKEYTV